MVEMPAPAGPEPQPPGAEVEPDRPLGTRALERIKELDHLHRLRLHGPWQSGAALVASLRFLRTALRHLVRAPLRPPVAAVPRPAPGALAVTLVGHASVLMSTSETRLLTDPMLADFLWGLR